MLQEFQLFRTILCVCPCCGHLERLSDLKLRFKGKAPRTWIDDFEEKDFKLQEKEQVFEGEEEKLREKAREVGRKAAEKAINRLVSPAIRSLKLDPYDVKSILHPVDYVVFRGMDKKESVDEVLFLADKSASSLDSLRLGIKDAISKKEYSWQVARITEDGRMEME